MEKYKQKISDLEEQVKEEQKAKWDAQNKKVNKDIEIKELEQQIESMKKFGDTLQKEIEIFRKYYKLDEEPSDEIKAKIHIDLEINRLKEEMIKMIALRPRIQYFPQPYPYYGWRY